VVNFNTMEVRFTRSMDPVSPAFKRRL